MRKLRGGAPRISGARRCVDPVGSRIVGTWTDGACAWATVAANKKPAPAAKPSAALTNGMIFRVELRKFAGELLLSLAKYMT
jgi:hypothetical protein